MAEPLQSEHQEIGGNLAELMEKLALTIGDKQEMDKKLQAYSVMVA